MPDFGNKACYLYKCVYHLLIFQQRTKLRTVKASPNLEPLDLEFLKAVTFKDHCPIMPSISTYQKCFICTFPKYISSRFSYLSVWRNSFILCMPAFALCLFSFHNPEQN